MRTVAAITVLIVFTACTQAVPTPTVDISGTVESQVSATIAARESSSDLTPLISAYTQAYSSSRVELNSALTEFLDGYSDLLRSDANDPELNAIVRRVKAGSDRLRSSASAAKRAMNSVRVPETCVEFQIIYLDFLDDLERIGAVWPSVPSRGYFPNPFSNEQQITDEVLQKADSIANEMSARGSACGV